MAEKGADIITRAGKNAEHKRAINLARKHSPDLSKKVAIVINSKTTVYVDPEILEERGVEYYYEKYKKHRTEKRTNELDS